MDLILKPKIGEIYCPPCDITLFECVFYDQTSTFIFDARSRRITKDDAVLVLYADQKVITPGGDKIKMHILLFDNRLYYTFAFNNFKKLT